VGSRRSGTCSITPAVSKDQVGAIVMGWLQEALDALEDLGPKGGLERFASSLEPAWIDEALAATGTVSVRRRKFPAEQAIWLVLGMALYADRPIKAVVDHLGLVTTGDRHIAASAISKARYRLGPKPMMWLFERVAKAWSGKDTSGGYRGLGLYGVDGTHLRVPDSDENFMHFGKPGGRSGQGDSGYPQLRMVALLNLSSRLLAAARMGPFAESEQALVKDLWSEIPNNSLTIADRGFISYMSFLELVADGENRHFLIRLKSDSAFEVVRELPDGSVIALIHPPKYLLKKDPSLPGPIEVRIITYQHEGGQPSRIATTLVDHETYPAQELIDLYHERWELEVSFDELKTHMLERKESLRSKKPDGIYQELWGQLLVYNLVRREMLLTANACEIPAARISFRASLLWIRDFWTTAWMISPGNVPRSLADLRDTLTDLILPERRTERRYPRHVKIKMSNYPRNRGRRPAPKRRRASTRRDTTKLGGSLK